MVYWEVTEPEKPIVLECGSEKLKDYRAELSSLIFQIKTNEVKDFEKTEDVQRCRYCVYRTYCNRPSMSVGVDEFLSSEYLSNEEDADILNGD